MEELEVDKVLAALRKQNSPREIYERIQQLGDPGEAPGILRGKYHLARGVVLNRLELPDDALAELDAARRIFDCEGHDGQNADAATEIARVYSWRGNANDAAFALLDATLAARKAGPEYLARVFIECGRLSFEIGRFEKANAFVAAALESGEAMLDPTERNAAIVLLVQTFVALSRFAEASRAMARVDQASATPRVFHVLAMERARIALRSGKACVDPPSAAAYPSDSFEACELKELEAEIAIAEGRCADALRLIRAVIARFAEDDLAGREIRARIAEANILGATGDPDGAVRTLAIALRRSRARHLPGHADRVMDALRDLDLPVPDSTTDSDPPGLPALGDHHRFVRRRPLSAGGSGRAQRAYDLETGIEVNLKTIELDTLYDPVERARRLAALQNEIANARRVRHPGVARVHGLVEDGDQFLLVREFVEGQTLREVMIRRLAPSKKRDILAELGQALSAIHAIGIVHRDIKPENVILRSDGHPVIIDLGASAPFGAKMGAGLSPDYAAPEQLAEHSVDGRADIFAFATIVFEFMVGTRPERLAAFPLAFWGAWSWTHTLRRQLQQNNIPKKLAHVLVSALRPEPRKRPTLGILVDALLEGSDESATPSR